MNPVFENFQTTDFLEFSAFLKLTGIFFLVIFIRYLIISGIFNWIFYGLLKYRFQTRIINQHGVRKKQVLREIIRSAITSLAFAFSGTVMVVCWQKGYTALYFDWGDYPIWYTGFSLFIILFLHETYYYWVHRWMHRPRVFRVVHRAHHESVITTSHTSFSFHPWESVLQALIIPLMVFFIPMHIYVLIFVLVLMTVSGTINHAGVELYPSGFEKHWLGKWLIGATHHDFHHKKFNCNYGLYFTFWDRWMGTENPDYKIP